MMLSPLQMEMPLANRKKALLPNLKVTRNDTIRVAWVLVIISKHIEQG